MSWLQDSNLVLFEIEDDGNCLFRAMSHQLNCLFRAVADQVYGDPNLHSTVRKGCAKFTKEEKHFYEEFIEDITNFSKYIEDLCEDGAWAGNFELIAISEAYNCRLEVYENSENPRVVNAWDFQGSSNPTIRLQYRNSHYVSVRSGGVPNIHFPAIEPGQLENKMVSQSQFFKSQDFQNCTQLEEDLSPDLKYAVQLSKVIEESRKSFLRDYGTIDQKGKNSQYSSSCS